MAIRIKLKGFDDLLKDIEAAGGSIDKACISALSQSAQIMQTELKSEMKNSGVAPRLVERMPQFEVKPKGNRFTAYVGYKETPYTPSKISDYHKAIFLNYGTPNRKKHGKIPGKNSKLEIGFVQRAKKSAKPKIKKQQKLALNKILKRLEK